MSQERKLSLPPYFGTKVVTSAEMARVEKIAIREGCSEEAFIDEAGKKVALAAIRWVEENALPKNITLLIGKGNKGADAYAAGRVLLEEGFSVRAFVCFHPDSCSEWNRKKGDQFRRQRGQIVRWFEGEETRWEEGLIIDGLLGTGFRGKVEGKVEETILKANGLNRPILAIDLPSGLDGTTGEISGACIEAEATVSLGMAKSGLFLREGWNRTGRLIHEDFGMPKRYVDLAKEVAYLPDPAQFSLPTLIRNRHKYQAGYVVGFSGSETMRGAPKLAGLGALRAGAGIVRIFHDGAIGDAPMELICQKWNRRSWLQELKRAQSVFAGPGLGKRSTNWMKEIDIPAVIDADALQKGAQFPKKSVLTPHRREMLRLLGLGSFPQEEELLARCQKLVERNRSVLILKGAPTFIFSPGSPPLIVPRGDPGMATAGTGDVLTGILAGLIAQGLELRDAAAIGVYLHATAGEIAAKEKSSYSLIASDLIEALPTALKGLIRDISDTTR